MKENKKYFYKKEIEKIERKAERVAELVGTGTKDDYVYHFETDIN